MQLAQSESRTDDSKACFFFLDNTTLLSFHYSRRWGYLKLLRLEFIGDDSDSDHIGNDHGKKACNKEKDNEDEADDI